MESKFISLLMNVPVRHAFYSISGGGGRSRTIIDKLKVMAGNDLDNFFVFGNLSSIGKVLNAAEQLEMLGNKKNSWTVITSQTDSAVIKCGQCSKATVMFARPRPSKTSAAASGIDGIKRTYDLTSNSDVEVAFYFDATLKAIMAIRYNCLVKREMSAHL